MTIASDDFEKLGQFYLGKKYFMETSSISDELVLYDSKDLVTHGVVLGMTGSGKTGLCLSLLEEAAMDNIPSIVIDPKGDISNLMLAFPDFKGEDFRPWIHESDAEKEGLTPDQFAEKTAEMWKKGIGTWGQGSERVRSYKNKVDINIFTPGSEAGVPVSIMGSLEVPPQEVLDEGELLGDRIESTVSSLLSLVGIDADPIQSKEAILLSSILTHCWSNSESLTIKGLIRHIQKPSFSKIGIIDVETFLPSKKRQDLALKFNALIASPGFSSWLKGPPLEIQKMLYQDDGKARISIFSIAHLSDQERMFFVSILLNQMLAWMRTQGGTNSLRALLYMDEIYGYLPPSANPPSKKPLMTMLKQARAFGLGLLLATQNPVDLDYKALSNIGTWWLGRLQTERDKMRVLDGLEGSAALQGFDRSALEKILAGLDTRVFLMNNVHEDGPLVFHVRWVMSYLTGPLTRLKIKQLMDPKRSRFMVKAERSKVLENPMGMPNASKSSDQEVERPAVGKGVKELFAPVAGDTDGTRYVPHLLRAANVYFNSSKCRVDAHQKIVSVCKMKPGGIEWNEELVGLSDNWNIFLEQPQQRVYYEDLPAYAMNAKNYRMVKAEFEEFIYRKERLGIFYCPSVKEYSSVGESEGDFRARLAHAAREARDEAVEKLRAKIEKKLTTKQGQMKRALSAVERERNEASSAKVQAGISIMGSILGAFMGRKKMSASALSRGSSAVNSTSRAMKQGRDVRLAEIKVEDLERNIASIENELANEIAKLDQKFSPDKLALEKEILKPYKKDIDISFVGILWLPFDRSDERAF